MSSFIDRHANLTGLAAGVRSAEYLRRARRHDSNPYNLESAVASANFVAQHEPIPLHQSAAPGARWPKWSIRRARQAATIATKTTLRLCLSLHTVRMRWELNILQSMAPV